jgi:nitrite reductase (NO-forming)
MLVAFFACATAMLVAGGASALAGTYLGWSDARWLALHLAFVGGISQLVLGAAQFFSCAFLATDPPPRWLLRAQLVVWNAGVLAIAAGVLSGLTALTGLGGACVLGGLALLAASLRGMRRRSLQRAPWATRWYDAAALFLAFGALLGPLMAADVAWSHGSLLGAHLVLNLGGWFGSAIVGTLHTFHPSLTGTRLRWPALQRVTFAGWTGGVAILAYAVAFDSWLPALLGWTGLAAAAALLVANVAASERGATQRTLAGALVASAQVLLLAAAASGIVLTAGQGVYAPLLGEHRDVIATLAVCGWIGLTVAGSLLHLLALMARVRRLDRPARPPTRKRSDPIVAASAIAAVAALAGARLVDAQAAIGAATVVVLALYAILGSRVVRLALGAVRAAPLRI